MVSSNEVLRSGIFDFPVFPLSDDLEPRGEGNNEKQILVCISRTTDPATKRELLLIVNNQVPAGFGSQKIKSAAFISDNIASSRNISVSAKEILTALPTANSLPFLYGNGKRKTTSGNTSFQGCLSPLR